MVMLRSMWVAVLTLLHCAFTLSQSAAQSAAETKTLPEVASMVRLDLSTAEQWGQLVLRGVNTEFPNKLALVYSGPEQIKTPREHFPAFFGCFDWHSSVHGHWVLVRLLKQYPNIESAPRIRQVLAEHLTAENLQREADFFARDEQKAFERMYGWAWLLRLTLELDDWDDPDAMLWREHLRPLEQVLVQRIEAYLPLLNFPIRTGEHPDTAFALGQIIDYARAMKLVQLEQLVADRARGYYRADVDYPVQYEPSGQDFFSSCWNEADLLRRVLPTAEFLEWLETFLPQLETQLTDGTIAPVVVTDPTDGKLVHLAGLNLHRAWCMRSVAQALPAEHALRGLLLSSAEAHLAAGLQYVNSGHYEGDHWLATFGLYAIEGIGIAP